MSSFELCGVDWLNSASNRRYEKRVVRQVLPLITVATGLGKLGVRLMDNEACPLQSVDRALLPGRSYRIEKLGVPGPHKPISNLLNRLMLDELPQLQAVGQGTSRLVGPRGTEPMHRARLFDCIGDGRIIDDWTRILECQQPGLLSTYALSVRERETTTADSELEDKEVEQEALARYEADAKDLRNASAGHSRYLVAEFITMASLKARKVLA